jgi:hypothetical protein
MIVRHFASYTTLYKNIKKFNKNYLYKNKIDNNLDIIDDFECPDEIIKYYRRKAMLTSFTI